MSTVDVEEIKNYVKYFLELHKKGVLDSEIKNGLSFFNKIFSNEQMKQKKGARQP